MEDVRREKETGSTCMRSAAVINIDCLTPENFGVEKKIDRDSTDQTVKD